MLFCGVAVVRECSAGCRALSMADHHIQQLTLTAPRVLTPADLMMGCVWLGPHPRLPDSLNQNRGQHVANDVVTAALIAGVRHFDTAPLYGFGASEERLGEALATACRRLKLPAVGQNGQDTPQVYTKTGRLVREPADGQPCPPGFEEDGATPLDERVVLNDYSGKGVMLSLAESLGRMGLSDMRSIHTLRVHDPNDNGQSDGMDEVNIAALQHGACEAMVRMRESGVITHVSLGMNSNNEGELEQNLSHALGSTDARCKC
jgi:aryl-alcohol dehydrogenase-like predicted oxidoreductase